MQFGSESLLIGPRACSVTCAQICLHTENKQQLSAKVFWTNITLGLHNLWPHRPPCRGISTKTMWNKRKDHRCFWNTSVAARVYEYLRGFCSHDSWLEPTQSQTVKWKYHRISATDSWIVAEGVWWKAHPRFQSKWHFRSCTAWQHFPFTSLSADHLHSNWSEAQSSCSYPWQLHGLNQGWLQNSIIYTFVCVIPHKPCALSLLQTVI